MNRLWAWLCILSLVFLGGFYLRPGLPAAEPVARQTATVQLGSFADTVIATGVIRPVVGAEVNVGSRISGTVVNLPVAVGDSVLVGDLLAELDRTALEAAVDQARADVALAQPRIELAQSNLRRLQTLTAKGLSSTQALDTAVADLAVERAQLAVSQSRLRSAQINLGYSTIIAPISGVVAEVSTREGETVAAGFASPTFVTIVDLSRLEVLAYVDETDIGRVFVGQQATFSVDTYPDQSFSASVLAIQPKAELQGSVVNYVARLQFEPVDTFVLRPEMTAHVRLVLAQRDDSLMVPRRAIKRRQGQQFVVVERAGSWVESQIRTGARTDTHVEVLSGLAAGETVELNNS